MKIMVVDFAASEGGALSVLKDFANYVKKNGHDHEWVFLLSDNYIETEQNIDVKIFGKGKVKRLFFDAYLGAKLINNLKPDVVLNFQNTYINGVVAPQIIYLHQAIPFQSRVNFSFFKKEELNFAIIQKLIGKLIKKGLPKADGIIVQTQWMKEAVLEVENTASNKVFLISPPIKMDLKDINEDEINFNSFFYPTGDAIYKNISIIENATKLISDLDFSVQITTNNKSNQNQINYIGKISREDVFRKYKQSILLFPSKIESYGLPLAEAKFTNSIIFASDTMFSREILNDYNNAYFFDPDEPQELAHLMKKCIDGQINHHNNPTEYNRQIGWNQVMDVIVDKHLKPKARKYNDID